MLCGVRAELALTFQAPASCLRVSASSQGKGTLSLLSIKGLERGHAGLAHLWASMDSGEASCQCPGALPSLSTSRNGECPSEKGVSHNPSLIAHCPLLVTPYPSPGFQDVRGEGFQDVRREGISWLVVVAYKSKCVSLAECLPVRVVVWDAEL